VHIWVDADACPNAIRDILYRAAARTRTRLTLVAGRPVNAPRSPWVTAIVVATGIDAADDEIVARVAADDLVITADIPLAARVVATGAAALNPRGEFYTAENIGERLAARNLMTDLRNSGLASGGPPPLGAAERQRFANALDRWLAQGRIRL
jgi:uncharacterized protein YaiI (UPF0178 family)